MDGVYDCDPKKNPDAMLHRMLSYGDVRTRKLSVMDETAITLCKENNIPVVVFNLTTPGNILRAVTGDDSIGTTVCDTLVSFLRPICRGLHHVRPSSPIKATPVSQQHGHTHNIWRTHQTRCLVGRTPLCCIASLLNVRLAVLRRRTATRTMS